MIRRRRSPTPSTRPKSSPRTTTIAADALAAPGYWLSRLLFLRALALIYLVAFLVAANQFRPLLGERGMLPIPRFVSRVPFRRSPSLFHFHYSDRFFAGVAWAGGLLSAGLLAGLADVPWLPLGVAMGL